MAAITAKQRLCGTASDNAVLFCRLWLFPASPAQRQQQIICFEDFLRPKYAVIQDLVADVNKKLGQKHINGTFRVQNEETTSNIMTVICYVGPTRIAT